MGHAVTDNRSRSRYEVVLDGDVAGFAEYVDDGNSVVMPHTLVEHEHRGKGLAALLVRHALDDLRSRGRTVVPVCWYVDHFIAGHPEYTDLVSGR
ncbi:MAG: GNAT family N-acetyltransferase [Ilumatobacteraceae bacterium]